VEKNYLTEPQLVELESIELTGLKHQHRLMFLWSLYSGGLRIRDCLDLRWRSIRDGRLVLTTGKTGTDVGFKLVSKALQILEHFKGLRSTPPKPDDFVFPLCRG
jgi:integrase